MPNPWEYKVQALIKEIPKWLKEFGQEMIVAFTGYVGAEMDDYSPSKSYTDSKSDEAFPDSEATWSDSPRLRVKSGRLLKSFTPKKPGSISEIKTAGYRLDVSIGSNLPYAAAQETGMFIKSKGRMQNYFWAKYIQSRNEFFRIMALSVIKRGGIKLKKRRYFSLALKKFEQQYLAKWLNMIFARIVKALT